MKGFALTVLIIGFFAVCLGKTYGEPEMAYAQEAWKTEFEDLCSRTDNAEALARDELRGIVERCDKLKPVIEKLDESARKVYLKRLSMCRDFFVYMLELKDKE